jgi:hypothetical protein
MKLSAAFLIEFIAKESKFKKILRQTKKRSEKPRKRIPADSFPGLYIVFSICSGFFVTVHSP